MSTETGARSLEERRRDFRDPGVRFRASPFWGWNGRLAPEELARGLDEVKERGMGGFFIHSRDGLETPYRPAGSALFVLDRTTARASSESRAPAARTASPAVRESVAILGPEARATRLMPNALVLDRAAFRIGGNAWSEELDLWAAQDRLREALGMRSIQGIERCQRYTWIGVPHHANGTVAGFLLRFEVTEPPVGKVCLALEAWEDVRSISLNASVVDPRPEGYYLDRAIRTIPLPRLRRGENTVEIVYGYREGTEIEDCAIIGDFGVDTQRRIGPEPERLRSGDWCLQGFFHYPGAMVYHFDVSLERKNGDVYELELRRRRAVAVTVRVNGMRAGVSPWTDASRIDLTEHVVDGENRIEIEVIGSPRNFFGPFHDEKGGATVDWSSFRKEGARGYSIVPYGLYEPLELFRVRRES